MVRKIGKFLVMLAVLVLLSGRVLEAEEIPKVYQIIYQEADGNYGYYRTAPEIKIKHFGGRYITRYQLSNSNGDKVTGKLSGSSEEVLLSQKVFGEGEHSLDVWMETSDGKVIAGTETMRKIKIDRVGPSEEIQFIFEKEGETPLYFSGETSVEIKAEDEGSGVEGIYYKLGDESEQYMSGNHIFVSIPMGFRGKVSAYAVDKAGNVGNTWESKEVICGVQNAEEGTTVFEDETAPKIIIEGLESHRISGRDVEFACLIEDDNDVVTLKGEIVWEKSDGRKETLTVSEWRKEEKKYVFQDVLNQDGIYQLLFEAMDQAGNLCKQEKQIVIDKTNPVIKKVNELNGAKLESFQWKYDIEQIVTDFTAYTYEVRMDGILCDEERIYTEEGEHVLEISVTDAAGNKSKATAKFMIAGETESLSATETGEDEYSEQEQDIQEVDVKTEEAKENVEEVKDSAGIGWVLWPILLLLTSLSGFVWVFKIKNPYKREEAR